jgi:hypothetical protein
VSKSFLCLACLAFVALGCKKEVFTLSQTKPAANSPGAAGSKLSPDAEVHKTGGGFYLTLEVRGDGQTISLNQNNLKRRPAELIESENALQLTYGSRLFMARFKRLAPYQKESPTATIPGGKGEPGILRLYVDKHGHLGSATCEGSTVEWAEEDSGGQTELVIRPSATGVRIIYERPNEAKGFLEMLKREGKL